MTDIYIHIDARMADYIATHLHNSARVRVVAPSIEREVSTHACRLAERGEHNRSDAPLCATEIQSRGRACGIGIDIDISTQRVPGVPG